MLRQALSASPARLAACFRGWNGVIQLAAIPLTYALVASGADWRFFEWTRTLDLHWLIYLAGIGGFFVPVVLPVILYVYGELRSQTRFMTAGVAIVQASALAWILSSTYKAFTGRTQPEFLTNFGTTDISGAFHFGFWQNGIFWGWPSSHTAVAVAGMVALMYVMPRSRVARYGGLVYAVMVASGAAIGFHWLSDVLAGAMVGGVVGSVVGLSLVSQEK